MIYTMKNKYIVRWGISEAKFREIFTETSFLLRNRWLKYFCIDIEAAKIAKLTGISEKTLSKYFTEIRILMANECEKISKLSGEIEIDESYFLLRNLLGGAKRVRGKRGRGALCKTPVFSFAAARWNAKTREKSIRK